MKRNIYAMALCVLMLMATTLSGCRLAREDAGADVAGDKLAGVFITTEHLDLFDLEGYLNDNPGGFRGGEITLGEAAEEYQGRLYAALTARTLTNEETGESAQTEEYVFPIGGIPYFSAFIPGTEGRDGYHAATSDPAVSDGHAEYKTGDGGDSVTLTGTIYVSVTGGARSFFFNPVYQSADGRVYLTAGTGMSAPMAGEGSAMTQTMDETATSTVNGETRTDSMSVTLSVSTMLAPEKIFVLQMDGESAVLSREEYAPGAVPEHIVTEAGADYLIVETRGLDNTGQTQISREIYDSGAESIETFYTREDGVCVGRWTRIEFETPGANHRFAPGA